MAQSKTEEISARGLPIEVAAAIAQRRVVTLAGAGTTLAAATEVSGDYNIVATATGSSADSVRLPNGPIGEPIRIENTSGATINIFPHDANGTINSGSGGSAQTMATGKTADVIRVSSTNWRYLLIN